MIDLLGVPQPVVGQLNAEDDQQAKDQRTNERGEGRGLGPWRDRVLRDGGRRHQARMDARRGKAGLYLLRLGAHFDESAARRFGVTLQRVEFDRCGRIRKRLAGDRTQRAFQLARARCRRCRLASGKTSFARGGILCLRRGGGDHPCLFLLHAARGFGDLRRDSPHLGMLRPIHHRQFAAGAGQVVQLPPLLVQQRRGGSYRRDIVHRARDASRAGALRRAHGSGRRGLRRDTVDLRIILRAPGTSQHLVLAAEIGDRLLCLMRFGGQPRPFIIQLGGDLSLPVVAQDGAVGGKAGRILIGDFGREIGRCRSHGDLDKVGFLQAGDRRAGHQPACKARQPPVIDNRAGGQRILDKAGVGGKLQVLHHAFGQGTGPVDARFVGYPLLVAGGHVRRPAVVIEFDLHRCCCLVDGRARQLNHQDDQDSEEDDRAQQQFMPPDDLYHLPCRQAGRPGSAIHRPVRPCFEQGCVQHSRLRQHE